MKQKIEDITQRYLQLTSEASTLQDLDELFLKLFGKAGEVAILSKNLSKLSKDELKKIGPLFNQTKQELEQAIEGKRSAVREEFYKSLEGEQFSLTPCLAGRQAQGWKARKKGYMHPMTIFEQEIVKLFADMGFKQFDAPHIDNDHNNFEVLNIPDSHPARDMWDTFYINNKLLLRTHTSNSQIRIMQENKLPIRMMSLGRCFRYENVDARHEHTFEQFEIVYIDKGVSMANLQYLSEIFLKAVFGSDMKVRLRPKYYPFVEPGVGVDGLCIFCKGKGCNICGGVGWLELAGAGMIHPTVLKNGGIDPNEYSGIAWGFGPARMLMLKHGVSDMRAFNTGDLEFLQKL